MSTERVSIIITFYNQEGYLREAIESAIEQTVKPCEIIVADDHSTKDHSVETIRSYEARFPGWVRGVFQPNNLGIPRNRNCALERVTGDYVAILDGDDRLLPNFIESHLSALAARPDAEASYGERYDFSAQGERHHQKTTGNHSGCILDLVAQGRSGILRTLLARFELVRKVGSLDPAFPLHDGFVLTLRLAAITEFAYVPAPVMEKRQHPEGASKKTLPTERAEYFESLRREVLRVIADHPAIDRALINEKWQRRIMQQHVLAELERHRKGKAWALVSRALFQNPWRISLAWKLGRLILRS
jgi:glycosyltransferase involved in cell wall biosynthesis